MYMLLKKINEWTKGLLTKRALDRMNFGQKLSVKTHVEISYLFCAFWLNILDKAPIFLSGSYQFLRD